MSIIPFIRRHAVPISIIGGVAVIAYVVIMGWGDTLGVDPEFKAQVHATATALFGTLSAAALRVASKDSDGDGTPDILDDDSTTLIER